VCAGLRSLTRKEKKKGKEKTFFKVPSASRGVPSQETKKRKRRKRRKRRKGAHKLFLQGLSAYRTSSKKKKKKSVKRKRKRKKAYVSLFFKVFSASRTSSNIRSR
jgi:hypothetical protein